MYFLQKMVLIHVMWQLEITGVMYIYYIPQLYYISSILMYARIYDYDTNNNLQYHNPIRKCEHTFFHTHVKTVLYCRYLVFDITLSFHFFLMHWNTWKDLCTSLFEWIYEPLPDKQNLRNGILWGCVNTHLGCMRSCKVYGWG